MRASAASGLELPGVYPSPVLVSVLDEVLSRPKPAILDLGPATAANVDYFSQYSCRLYLADFWRGLLERESIWRQDLEGFRQCCEEVVSPEPDARFDVALCWDLLNYLRLDEIAVLLDHIAAFSKTGTRALALLSIGKKIPDLPLAFNLLDGGRLRYESRSASLRDSPRHLEPDLARHMPGFTVERGMLLRHGFREYAFRCVAARRPAELAVHV